MTKRTGKSTYHWLNTGLVAIGIMASLFGARHLQKQDARLAATTLDTTQRAMERTTIQLPASINLQNGQETLDAIVVELAPVPTVAASVSAPRPAPVARTRSSR